MTKAFLLLTVALCAAAMGCKGDECDQQNDRINDYIESCDGLVPPETEKEECTAEAQKQLRDAADAFVKTTCESVRSRYPK